MKKEKKIIEMWCACMDKSDRFNRGGIRMTLYNQEKEKEKKSYFNIQFPPTIFILLS